MEQKDYLLREIEKIGLLLRALLRKLIMGSTENSAISPENQFEADKELLLNDTGFNMDEFVSLNNSEIGEYISKFDGIQGTNLELLADVLREAGTQTNKSMSAAYLAKALKLYEWCNLLDKTYSFERESKISELRGIIG